MLPNFVPGGTKFGSGAWDDRGFAYFLRDWRQRAAIGRKYQQLLAFLRIFGIRRWVKMALMKGS